MRILYSSSIAFVFYAFQNFDFIVILREFGFPIIVAVVMFWYFSRQISRRDDVVTEFRVHMLNSLNDQTTFLRKLLEEARQTNAVCRFLEKAEEKKL